MTIRKEVVSLSKGVGHNWVPSTDEITPHQFGAVCGKRNFQIYI